MQPLQPDNFVGPVAQLMDQKIYCIACRSLCVLSVPMAKPKIARHLPSYLYCVTCQRRLERATVAVTPQVLSKVSADVKKATEAAALTLDIKLKPNTVASAVQEVLRRATARRGN